MSSMHSSQERKVCEQNSDLFLGLSSIGIAEFHRKDKKEGRKENTRLENCRLPRTCAACRSTSPSFLFLPSGYYGGGTRAPSLPPPRFHFWRRMQSDSICGSSLAFLQKWNFRRPPARSPSFRSISLLNFLLGSRGALFRSVCPAFRHSAKFFFSGRPSEEEV